MVSTTITILGVVYSKLSDGLWMLQESLLGLCSIFASLSRTVFVSAPLPPRPERLGGGVRARFLSSG